MRPTVIAVLPAQRALSVRRSQRRALVSGLRDRIVLYRAGRSLRRAAGNAPPNANLESCLSHVARSSGIHEPIGHGDHMTTSAAWATSRTATVVTMMAGEPQTRLL